MNLLPNKQETPSVGAQGESQTRLDSRRSEDGNTSAGVNDHSAPSTTGFNPQISLCSDANDTATQTVSLRDVLAEIKDGTYKKQVEFVRTTLAEKGMDATNEEYKKLKKKLPAVLFSGEFSKRNAVSLVQHSGILCVDIDAADNEAVLQRAETRSLIEKDQHTLAVFTSPSGTGLKVLVRIPTSCPHIDAFDAARDYFKTKFGLKIDEACKEVNRICFTSYDPVMFSRDDAPELPVQVSQTLQVSTVHAAVVQCSTVQAMPSHFGSMTKDEVRKHLAAIPTRPDYPVWLEILSAVWSTLSYPDGLEVLQEWSPEEKSGEYQAKYAARLTAFGPGTLVHYSKLGGGTGVQPATPTTGKPFTLWSPSQCMSYQPPVGSILLDNGYLVRGEMTSFLGIGGLGKTRMALWLAVCQILGRDWCDLPSHGAGVTWLFLSTESGLSRWKNDLSLMMGGLSNGDQSLVDAHLRVLALVPGEDGYINFGSLDSSARLAATLQQVKPAVIVLDPLADMIDGDENATADVVKTLRGLSGIHKMHAPDAAVLIIHHSRTGVQNVIQAGDNFSSGNFGRGSKALYSKVRCELQLAPGDRDDPTKLVLSCGKANDCAKFAPRGVIFDPQTCTYSCDPSFDVQAWRDDLNGKRRRQLVSVVDVICAVRDTISVGGAGTTEVSTAAIVATLQRSVPACGKTVIRRLNESLPKGYILKGSVRGLWALGPKANLIP